MRLPGDLALYSGIAIVLVGGVVWYITSRRKDPHEKERLRRQSVNLRGRMGDAMITDATEDTIYYSYTLRGVEYHTSQDVSTLRHRMPDDPSTLIGPATMKYVPTNPSNSILLCEDWSGFRNKSSSTFINKGA